MHRIFRVKAYEMEHGPHFNEEHARKAVMKMENEDGTRGPHWSIEETTTISQLSNEHQTAAVGSMINQATAPIVTRLNDLQSDVDGIKCKLPNTVSVPYPQLTAINTDIYRAAAYGAYAGDVAYGHSGYGCGCNNYWG